MNEHDIQLTIQKAKDKYPEARPRVISDNGAQFISKEFKLFIKGAEFTHIRTSINYPVQCKNVFLTKDYRSSIKELLNNAFNKVIYRIGENKMNSNINRWGNTIVKQESFISRMQD